MPMFLFRARFSSVLILPIYLRNEATSYKLLQLQFLGEAVVKLLDSCDWVL